MLYRPKNAHRGSNDNQKSINTKLSGFDIIAISTEKRRFGMPSAKGSGCLVKRGKVYYARWVVDGRVYVKTTKCTSKKEAEKKLEDFVHPYQVASDIEKIENLKAKIKVLEDEAVKTPKENAIRLNLLLDAYLKDVNRSAISDSTDSCYTSKLKHLRNFFKTKTFAYEISPKDAAAFMLDLKAKASVSNYNLHLKVLKCLFASAMKQDTNIRKNPFDDIKPLKDAANTYRRELTPEEIDRLISEAKRISKEAGLLFTIGAYTGLRKGDCQKLKTKDVDMDKRIISLLPIKTRRNGIICKIPIVQKLHDELTKAYDKDEEYVMPEISQMSATKISSIVRDVFANAGIGITEKDKDGHMHIVTGFHSLRHTVASMLHRANTPINQMKMILGHSNINMSLHYAHVAESDLKMPDFSDTTAEIRISKDVFKMLDEFRHDNETLDAAILRLLKGYDDRQKSIVEIKEARDKENSELDAMLDEMFDK